ncbi:substrate-binding domain-containing protein [Solwaraspora sp. WMMD406]|uniref:phosphate ABC transporter substrate-binding protein PstS n=1 Tax=Solwaraspora sp. WMMD406 TaxID=3016095 RepID=UPI002415B4FD|nr:substrate-binding domain-containing protein [Solwaraspora sp. WMMD406]MDG4764955.1 substrate-binding domain-containing protein [Solwaraspora sp. WMMD406]
MRCGHRILVLLTALLVGVAMVPPAAHAQRLVQISGAGSSWSANALDNWRRNVQQRGIYVNYASTGSTDGRNQFRNGTADFGVSEIPYRLNDVFAGSDRRPEREFGYMPIVAGGTAFMYNLTIGGRRVTNLRLSGEVLAKIFTGSIKRWNDPQIAAHNPGLTLPARNIVPVVRQDGSGTSAQLTLWMSKRYPAIWNAYCARFGKPTPCGITSTYPFRTADGFVGASGSTGVAGYVAQANAEGAITYVEYSYAVNARFPVVKMLNAANYYVEPTASNVAVALTRARINDNPSSPDYLTQILDDVYAFDDPRSYPLSSYSYMIIPQKVELNVTRDKGFTLASFANYFLCEGQQQADVLGYSPLPINLVQAAMEQVRKIPGAPQQNIRIENCNNPTFSRDGTNTLARNAPQPSTCDRQGTTQSTAGTAGARQETPVNAAARCASGGGPSPGRTATPGATATPGGGATTAPPTTSAGTPTAAVPDPGAVIDPDTGEVVGDGSGDPGGDPGSAVAAIPVSLEGRRGWQLSHTMMLLASVLLVGLLVGPPLVAHRYAGRRDRGQS